MNLVHEGVLDPNEPDFRDEKRDAEEARRERETLANIVAAMHNDAELYHAAWLNDPNENPEADDVSNLLAYYASRIEAAWKRDRESVTKCNGFGNAAATREALEMARDALKSAEKYVYGDPPDGGAIGWDDVWPSEWHHALEAVELALSAPARQCDVGTAEEKYQRWVHFCEQRLHICHNCEINSPVGCTFKFGDMPYEAEEGGAE